MGTTNDVATIDDPGVEDNEECPGHAKDDPRDVLPLDLVVGVDSEAPIGLMAKLVDVSGIPDDADPDDEALPDGCVT